MKIQEIKLIVTYVDDTNATITASMDAVKAIPQLEITPDFTDSSVIIGMDDILTIKDDITSRYKLANK